MKRTRINHHFLWAGAAVCVAILFVVFQYWRGFEAHSGTPEERKELCHESIAKINNVREAVERGMEYWGGTRGYDLVCARLAFERAVLLDPEGDVTSWHQLGRIDFLEGRFEDALSKFQRQEELFGSQYPNVHYMKGLTYGYSARHTGNSDDWNSAEREFKLYLDFDALSPWARVDLAWVFFAQGKFEEMKPVLEKGLEINATNPWLLNMYGLALLNTGDKEGARVYFEAALSGANELSTGEWGRAYPGNDPALWSRGLQDFVMFIENNHALTERP